MFAVPRNVMMIIIMRDSGDTDRVMTCFERSSHTIEAAPRGPINRESSVLWRTIIQLCVALPLVAIGSFAMTEAARGQDTQGNAQAFLSSAQAAKTLADGRPWSGIMQNGRKATITLKPDGTGSFRGPAPLPIPATWSTKGDNFCVKISLAGTRCMRFRRVAGGLEGWRDNKPVMRLTR